MIATLDDNSRVPVASVLYGVCYMLHVACCMGHQVIATFDNNSSVPVQARAEFNRFLKFKVAITASFLARPMPYRRS